MKVEIKAYCEKDGVELEKISCEQEIEQELLLPDYCRDIKRILKCILTPDISSAVFSGDRLTVRGSCTARIIYLDDKDKIDCFEKDMELFVSGQSKQSYETVTACTRAYTNYVNCRALSPKKLSLKGNVAVRCTLYGEREISVPELFGPDIRIRKTRLQQDGYVCRCEKTFDMSETVALEKDKPDIDKLLRQQAYVTLEQVKASSGKLLLKGELTVRAVYYSESCPDTLQHLEHTMPLNQIIDMPGVEKEQKQQVDAQIIRLRLSPKSDSSHTGRLLEISARISCLALSRQSTEREYITDCYSTLQPLEAEYGEREILTELYCSEKPEDFTARLSLSGVSRLLDVWVSEKNEQMTCLEDKAQGRLRLTVSALYLDEASVPCYKEETVELSTELLLKGVSEKAVCEFSADITAVTGVTDSAGVPEITVRTLLHIRICNPVTQRYVTNVLYSDKKSADSPALTVYRCEKGERLWDIAKKYLTTVEAIKQENGIAWNEAKQDTTLLIPCV